ncbi:hypothetical protein LTR56_015543 [Elasticomyces elasticus]|nr:hypothetical protein LTR56_015543 [Elasticomyces elasticus]KAK3648309.1 hypothetical protein LTR22_013440 [Elasticomyces elasticus]KAK4916299.1 hypothetical protein LTR49_015671 [Elasticomyces elasticus]KAK5764941.1 hypothetical protein LTS12_004969 [Elasticomyces elasticus]
MEYGLQTNYFGAAIFWSYNVAALGLTTVVLQTLATLQPSRDGSQERRKRTRIFGAMAAISFSTLSFNMLNVLIQSYIRWPERFPSAYDRSQHSMIDSIWTWSTTSTLFRDFGEAIVADEARYLWVLSALMGTFSVCLYMATEGRRRSIPRLWAFFALSQILPISFAQNLFYIAILRQPAKVQPVTVRSLPNAGFLLVYSLLLSVAPRAAKSSLLMPLIIMARLLLVMPLFLVQSGAATNDNGLVSRLQRPVAIAAGLLIVRQAILALEENSFTDIVAALNSHPAVSALGSDLIISVMSFGAWIYSSPASEHNPSNRSKGK